MMCTNISHIYSKLEINISWRKEIDAENVINSVN